VLASRYPENPSMSYIPGVAWSGALRLGALTREDKWKERPRREMQPFLSGDKPAIAQPYLLSSLAGPLALSDLGEVDGNKEAATLAQHAADFILADKPEEIVKYARVVGRLLTTYSDKLQRPDGLFIHAAEGPYAWGRGNGFALMGLTEALTYLPESWPERVRVLQIYRRHVRTMIVHQSDDGSWRQVVDEPSSYRELTVTAMTVAAMARGVRRGWLDRGVVPVIDRGWRAVLARVNEDGTLRDVCSGTAAGRTREYYLNRPVINGADDRGGAMALLAAIEMEELRR
jgi:rhamnogalacturonyl hydrolase YesR